MRSPLLIFVLTLGLCQCGQESKQPRNEIIENDDSSNSTIHTVSRIMCSGDPSWPLNIDLFENGYIYFKGVSDFDSLPETDHYQSVYKGRVDTLIFQTIVNRLNNNNFHDLNEYDACCKPSPHNYLRADIFTNDSIKTLYHYNDSITSILNDILNLRFVANLKKTDQRYIFQTELKPQL